MLKPLFKQKKAWLALVVLVFVIDQVTKSWATSMLALGQPQPFLPFFNFTLLHNYGAAFSFLSDAGGWQWWFFTSVALAVSVFLVVWIAKIERTKKIELAGLSFILGGAIGNLCDRVLLGYVVDFVDWFYPASTSCLPFFYARSDLQSCHWPAFNVADSAILLGLLLLIIDMFFNQKNTRKDV